MNQPGTPVRRMSAGTRTGVLRDSEEVMAWLR